MYLMPALDDIASLYFYEGRWNVHYQLPNSEAVAADSMGYLLPEVEL